MSRRMLVGIVSVVAVLVLTLSAGTPQSTVTGDRKVTPPQFEQSKKDLNNWGRWGKDDEIGTMNFITPAKRKQAAALVKEGFSVSLAADVDTEKAIDNPNPYEHAMLGLGTDRIGVAFHGIAHTHLDSLAHINYDGKFYNGYTPQQDVVMKDVGHAKNSIHNLKNGIFTRGILLDIPRLKGVPYLEPGTPIYVEDLEAWEKKAGVKVSAGDAVLIRTGRWARRAKVGPWAVGQNAAGLHASVAPWFKARGVALVGSDAAEDVTPSRVEGVALPIHTLFITAMGINLLDNQDLEALGAA